MAKPFQSKLTISLVLFLVACISAIAIDLFLSDWPLYAKAICPGILLLIAIFKLFPKKEKDETDSNTTNKKKKNKNGEFTLGIFNLGILLVVAFVIYLIMRVIIADYKEAIRAGDKPSTGTTITNPLPIDHSNTHVPDENEIMFLDYNEITNIFQVRKNQKWIWTFQYDLAYRIVPPDEPPGRPFKKLIRKESNNEPLWANHAGMLQVVSLKKGQSNHIHAILYTSIEDE